MSKLMGFIPFCLSVASKETFKWKV